MSKIEKIKEIIRKNKGLLAEEYNVSSIGIFGSYVRHQQKKGSDLDVLVEFERPIDLFEFIRLEEYLKRLVKVKVDLVSKKALKPFIGKHILGEVMYI